MKRIGKTLMAMFLYLARMSCLVASIFAGVYATILLYDGYNEGLIAIIACALLADEYRKLVK